MLEPIVRSFVEAMDAGHLDTLEAVLADDVAYHRPLQVEGRPGHRTYRGRPEVMSLLTTRAGGNRSRHDIDAYADDGRTAFVDGRVTTADGVAFRWTSVYRFDGEAKLADWLVLTTTC